MHKKKRKRRREKKGKKRNKTKKKNEEKKQRMKKKETKTKKKKRQRKKEPVDDFVCFCVLGNKEGPFDDDDDDLIEVLSDRELLSPDCFLVEGSFSALDGDDCLDLCISIFHVYQ